MLPDLVSLALFRKAVEFGSLSKAAVYMHMTLSAASRRISILEHQFGIQLMDRPAGGGIVPTAVGLAIAESSGRVLREVDRLRSEATEYARGIRGYVRLAVNTTAMGQGLPSDIARFTRQHPEIRVEVREIRSPDIIAAVRDGAADIGIAMPTPHLGGLRIIPYLPDRLCVVVPAEHSLAADAVRFDELLEFDFIGLDTNATQTELMRKAAERAGRSLRMPVQVQSFEALCRAVEAGMGIALLSSAAVGTYMQSLNIRTVDLDEEWAARQMVLCLREGPVGRPIEALAAFLQANPDKSTS